MLRRSLETLGEFILPYLKPKASVFDCGCGPGSITLDIADRVAWAQVIDIDSAESQIKHAELSAKQRGCDNVRFEACDESSSTRLTTIGRSSSWNIEFVINVSFG